MEENFFLDMESQISIKLNSTSNFAKDYESLIKIWVVDPNFEAPSNWQTKNLWPWPWK